MRDELDLSPIEEAEIREVALARKLDPELVLYYTRWGPLAPRPPAPPPRWQRAWWRLRGWELRRLQRGEPLTRY